MCAKILWYTVAPQYFDILNTPDAFWYYKYF